MIFQRHLLCTDMSNRMIHVQRSFRELAHAFNKFWLVESWFFGYMVQRQQIHRTAEGQWTTAFHFTMYLLPLDHVSKNQLSTKLVKRTCQFAEWLLDMYHSVGHVLSCIVCYDVTTLYQIQNWIHLNIYSGESFVKNTIFAYLLIHFIAHASLYLCNHESFQRTA